MKRIPHKPKFDLVNIIETAMQFPDSGDFAVLRKEYAKLIIAELLQFYELDSGLEMLSDVLPDSTDPVGDAAREINRLRLDIASLPNHLSVRLSITEEAARELLRGVVEVNSEPELV